MGRTIVIGDLHGCLDEATELLDRCQVSVQDRVILLGDLVDRGPQSGACVDLAMRLAVQQGSQSCIMGNHERKHLSYEDNLLGVEPELRSIFAARMEERMPATHVAARRQFTQEHYGYMRSLPSYLRLEEHGAIVVHAGLFPGVPIEAQSDEHLLHIQMIDPSQHRRTCWPSRVPPGEVGWRFWTNFWQGPELVIFGHSVLNEPLITEHLAGIDGGAVFGGKLHAFILPDRRVVSVNARKVSFSQPARGRGRDPIKLFKVHGDVCTYS